MASAVKILKKLNVRYLRRGYKIYTKKANLKSVNSNVGEKASQNKAMFKEWKLREERAGRWMYLKRKFRYLVIIK